MAIDDLKSLREQLPEVFDDTTMPIDWSDEWLIVPITDPESIVYESDVLSEAPAYSRDIESLAAGWLSVPDDSSNFQNNNPTRIPDFRPNSHFPGKYEGRVEGIVPPPDAFAFYFPFHFFYPKWWGVYLVFERVLELAKIIQQNTNGHLDLRESLHVVRRFLYGHEAFHHIVESFATRLEVTHRIPLYKDGFNRLFNKVYGTDECLEEAIANAHGLRRVKNLAFPDNKAKRDAALKALSNYVKQCPPGYRRGLEFVSKTRFDKGRFQLAEQYHNEALSIPPKEHHLWATFPHAFSGISRVTSRVNYIIHKDAPLAKRIMQRF